MAYITNLWCLCSQEYSGARLSRGPQGPRAKTATKSERDLIIRPKTTLILEFIIRIARTAVVGIPLCACIIQIRR